MAAPAIIAAIGAASGVLGKIQQSLAERDQLQQAARNLYTEAAQAMRQGEYVAMARALDLEQRIGAAKVAAATSGADTGRGQSISTGIAMTETFGRMDVDMERLNAARKARGLREQARQAEQAAESIMDQMPLTVLGGGASVASAYYGARAK